MELQHNEPKYYHALWDKISEMPIGESPELIHKSEEEKDKFENHICHWISTQEFVNLGFYIVFSNDYKKLIKREYLWKS